MDYKTTLLPEIWQTLRDNGLNGIEFDGEVELNEGITLKGFNSDGSFFNTATNALCQIENLEFCDLIALQEEVELQIYKNNRR